MNFFGYYVLNLKPTVLSFIGVPPPPPDWLRPLAVIEHVPWWHGTILSMSRRKYAQLRYKLAHIDHSLMVHAPDEEAKRLLFKVKGSFVSQNIYVDQNIFRPIPVEKRHDSLYIAQLRPFKRHHLAIQIESLRAVFGGDVSNRTKYQSMLPKATFDDHHLNKSEMAEAINSAFCTLALSKIEGGMLASFESLLCGVPVVSTHSKGGRDLFFNEQNSILVEDNPAAVAAGVRKFRQYPIDPNPIRARALADLEPHRVRFCQYVSGLVEAMGGTRVDPMERYQRYFTGPAGLADYFIWADKFHRTEEVDRINSLALRG